MTVSWKALGANNMVGRQVHGLRVCESVRVCRLGRRMDDSVDTPPALRGASIRSKQTS